MAKKSATSKEAARPHEPRIRNRKAFHEYHILEKVEAGLSLVGTEVKSLRAGQCQMDEAFARVEGGEVFLHGMNIAIYPQAVGVLQHDPLRPRKCLLHRRQIAQLVRLTSQKGHTIVPLEIYFHHGRAKAELGVGVGKKSHDKRETLKNRQAKRDMDREMRQR